MSTNVLGPMCVDTFIGLTGSAAAPSFGMAIAEEMSNSAHSLSLAYIQLFRSKITDTEAKCATAIGRLLFFVDSCRGMAGPRG
jgi:hypothetical protein